MAPPAKSMESEKRLETIIAEIFHGSEAAHPFIIGIGGGAGVGKTTFSVLLKNVLEKKGKKVLIIPLDDFFRSPEERERLGTEWGENHIKLGEARRVLESIRNGDAGITKPKYNRATKIIEKETVRLDGIDIVIFEGIYAISGEKRLGNFLEFLDLPVFMSAELPDMKRWRFSQEAEKPHPRSKAGMERHWNLGVLPDFEKNILPSKKNARFVISVDSKHGFDITV